MNAFSKIPGRLDRDPDFNDLMLKIMKEGRQDPEKIKDYIFAALYAKIFLLASGDGRPENKFRKNDSLISLCDMVDVVFTYCNWGEAND